MKSSAQMIREIREDRELKQSDVAKALGLKQQHYSSYETGVTELPVRLLVALADYYGVTTDYLLGRSDAMGLEKKVAGNYTVGKVISDLFSLDDHGRDYVLESLALQKNKPQSGKQKKEDGPQR